MYAALCSYAGCAPILEMTMKPQLSRRTKQSRPHVASSKVQANRRREKIEKRKGGLPTLQAKKNNGASQSKPRKIETERPAKQKLDGTNMNGGANVRAADMAPAANKKPSVLRQRPKRTLEHVERNGEAAAEQSITATAVNDKTDHFDRGLNRIWLDWTYATMPAALMTTKDLIHRKTPMDLMAIGSRRALSSWLDVWIQVLEGQRDRRTKPAAP
jgi:hypothetical protein